MDTERCVARRECDIRMRDLEGWVGRLEGQVTDMVTLFNNKLDRITTLLLTLLGTLVVALISAAVALVIALHS